MGFNGNLMRIYGNIMDLSIEGAKMRPSSSTPNNFPQALQCRRPGMAPQGASDGKWQKKSIKTL
jgi:hypothetical protein